MKLILFVIVFTCIIIIKIFAFIMKSAFDTAQVINGKQQNSISKTNHKNLFSDYILIVRERGICFSQYYNTVEEMLIAMEFYFFYMSIIMFCFGIESQQEPNKMRDTYLFEIVDYLNYNQHKIRIGNEYSDIDLHSYENLKEIFKNRLDKYSFIFKNYQLGDMYTTDGLLQTVTYTEQVTSAITNLIRSDLKIYTNSENNDVFCDDISIIFPILADIEIFGSNTAKNIIIEAQIRKKYS